MQTASFLFEHEQNQTLCLSFKNLVAYRQPHISVLSIQVFLDGKDIISVLVCIAHIIHAFLDHKDSQSAFFALLEGKRGVGVGFLRADRMAHRCR